MAGRREEIVEAAYNLMGTQGLEAVHARTVAAQLEINHATVHYYFAKRDDLLAGIAEYAAGRMAKDRAAIGEPKDGREGIENELALAEAYCRSTSRFAKVLIGLVASSANSPKVQAPLKVLWEEWTKTLTDLTKKAGLRKSSSYNDSEVFAAQLFGLMIAAHLNEGKMDIESKLDAIFDSLFKA